MSYFKKEERTASTNQILKLAEVFIGILNSQKKLDIDMTDKPTKADLSISLWRISARFTICPIDVKAYGAMRKTLPLSRW